LLFQPLSLSIVPTHTSKCQIKWDQKEKVQSCRFDGPEMYTSDDGGITL
jgi:hypothetical protein